MHALEGSFWRNQVCLKFRDCILIFVYACVNIGGVIAFQIRNSMESTS